MTLAAPILLSQGYMYRAGKEAAKDAHVPTVHVLRGEVCMRDDRYHVGLQNCLLPRASIPINCSENFNGGLMIRTRSSGTSRHAGGSA